MAANDGPVPVRTLAHAARLIREARRLGQYGVAVSEPVLDYPQLLARVREVVNDVRVHHAMRQKIDSGGSDRPRAGRCRALHKPAHHRNRDRATALGRKNHHLHWRREPEAPNPRLRVGEYP